jgi:hypothetical protein
LEVRIQNSTTDELLVIYRLNDTVKVVQRKNRTHQDAPRSTGNPKE